MKTVKQLSSLSLMVLTAGCVADPSATSQTGLAANCFRDQYGAAPAKTDILVVKDTSASMSNENAKIVAGMNAFVQALPAGVDYRVAVMLADAGKGKKAKGKLLKNDNDSSWILDGVSLSKDQLSDQLGKKLNVAQSAPGNGNGNSGAADEVQGEIGLTAINRVLDRGKVQSARAKGFFRADAALMVLIVSDNQDFCWGSSNSNSKYCAIKSPAQFDGNGQQVSAAVNEQVSAELVYGKLKRIQGNRPLMVGGVLYADAQTVPAQSGKAVGHGYLELIGQAQGFVFDLAQGDVSGHLTSLAGQVSTGAAGSSSFVLNSSVVDPSTVSVSINGVIVEAAYDGEANTVNLAQAVPAGSSVEINYCAPVANVDDEGEGHDDGAANGGGSDDGSDDGSDGDDSGDPDICLDLSCGFIPPV